MMERGCQCSDRTLAGAGTTDGVYALYDGMVNVERCVVAAAEADSHSFATEHEEMMQPCPHPPTDMPPLWFRLSSPTD